MSKFLGVALALWVTACGSSSVPSDSKSNWLRECTTQKSCGDDLSCVCGLCTKRCDDSATCKAQDAVCIDPSREGIDSTCASAPDVETVGICLQPCVRDGECGVRQRCVQGACLSKAAPATDRAFDAGLDIASEAGTTVVTPAIGDGGTPDGSATDATTSQCFVNVRACCAGDDRNCTNGTICHVDGSCMTPGTLDEGGVATLSNKFYGRVYAADAEFLYGFVPAVGREFGLGTLGTLARISLANGVVETFADGLSFDGWQSSPSPMVVDADRLYFLGIADRASLTASLWSMPKDGSSPPVAHGLAGKVLAHDAQYVFYSNDGDSRVLRVDKATLETSAVPQETFRSVTDAPNSIAALAINASKLFVIELVFPSDSNLPWTFNLHGVSVVSLVVEQLADSSKFTVNPFRSFDNSTASLGEDSGRIFANDDYLVLGGTEAEDRFDLATLEVKPLAGGSEFTAMHGGTLYGTTGRAADENGCWAVDLASAQRTYLLDAFPVYVRRILSLSDGMVVQAGNSYSSSAPFRLLRVVTQ